MLHDVLEDTDIRETELECRFGSLAMYAADKVCKVREPRVLIVNGPAADRAELKEDCYCNSLAMLEQAMPGHRLSVCCGSSSRLSTNFRPEPTAVD